MRLCYRPDGRKGIFMDGKRFFKCNDGVLTIGDLRNDYDEFGDGMTFDEYIDDLTDDFNFWEISEAEYLAARAGLIFFYDPAARIIETIAEAAAEHIREITGTDDITADELMTILSDYEWIYGDDEGDMARQLLRIMDEQIELINEEKEN